jgi:hypothetical protein
MGLRTKITSSWLEIKYKKHVHSKIFDWKWNSKRYNRVALVNFLVTKCGGHQCKYLEIGCASNDLFDSVFSLNKTGVDPKSGGTHRMLSDDFFEANLQEGFDVVFIDGLHEYQQVRRDAINSLNSLNEGGWIAFHDFLPSSWKEHHVPRIQSAWTGDCWKFAVELIKAKGLDFWIINIDHGVGLLRKSESDYSIPDLSSELSKAEFDKFVLEVPNMPIVEFEDAISFINSLSK